MDEELNEMLPEFLAESEEHLQTLNDKMLDLEEAFKGGSEMSSDDLNTMFRAAHTIKGTASFIGLNSVVKLTHKAETLLQKLRDGETKLTEAGVDSLFSAFDTLTSLLEALRDHGAEDVEIEESVAKLDSVLNEEEAGSDESVAEEKKEEAPAAEEKKEEAVPVEEPVKEEKPGQPEEKTEEQVEELKEEAPAPSEEKKVEKVSTGKRQIDTSEKYIGPFIVEVEQNLDELESLLLKAEKEPANLDVINNIFRDLHTIKGSSGIVNVPEIADVAHKMESILSFIREGEKPLKGEVISLLFEGIDVIVGLVGSIKKERMVETNIADIVKKLENCYEKLVSSDDSSDSVKEQESALPAMNVDEITKELDNVSNLSEDEQIIISDALADEKKVYLLSLSLAANSIKSVKYAIIEERLKKDGTISAVRPGVDTFDNYSEDLVFGFIFCTKISTKEIDSLLQVDELEVLSVKEIDASSLIKEKKQEEQVAAAVSQETKEEASKVKEEPKEEKGSKMEKTVEQDKNDKSAASKKAAPIEIATIRIDARKLDYLMNLSGELVIIRAKYSRLASMFSSDLAGQKEIARMAEGISFFIDELNKEMEAMLTETEGSADKNISKIKKIMTDLEEDLNALNEKISTNDIIEHIHTLGEITSTLEKVSSDIQSGVMQTRMVPVEGVFTRFKRIVRDISKSINKDVNLKIVGAETELDKNIVDSLGDPLTHMIRNAVDHGIESREERAETGKPEAGTVFLKASHKGNSICIEVGDDGKGTDPDKLAESAIRKGLLTQDQIEKMTEKEKLNIMFMPGFSTAEQVTGLSGRGVGMDVVRNMITSVNGVVDIETKKGQGTTFVLRIPLTLAIIQALLVSLGDEIYAFPIESVTEIIKVSSEEIYSVDKNDTVKLRDHALSLVDLEKVIKVKNINKKEEKSQKVVIITDGESQLGVGVDSLVGKDEIVIKPFSEHFSDVKGITGASILADGNVALILDPITIIREAR